MALGWCPVTPSSWGASCSGLMESISLRRIQPLTHVGVGWWLLEEAIGFIVQGFQLSLIALNQPKTTDFVWLNPSQLVSQHLLSVFTSAVLSETTPFGICVLSFSVASCKFLLMTVAKFLFVDLFFLGAFWLLVYTQQGWRYRGALRLGRNPHSDAQTVFESRFLAQLPTLNPCRILTYRVMFCFKQIKETGESMKCTCKSHDCKSHEYLEINL